jgi:CBS-domain-containing membrane protein
MTTQVMTVAPDASVRDVAARLLEHHITAVPVVDTARRVLGIVSEGDLIHRIAAVGGRHRSWLVNLFAAPDSEPGEFVKVHGTRAQDIMTREVVTVMEDAPVEEVARLLEERRIKRVPVLREDLLVGIVSRADLLRVVLAVLPEGATSVSADDQALRERIMAVLADQKWVHTSHLNIVVSDGVAQLWGFVDSDSERRALRVAAEQVPGIKRVEDRLNRMPMLW